MKILKASAMHVTCKQFKISILQMYKCTSRKTLTCRTLVKKCAHAYLHTCTCYINIKMCTDIKYL